MFYEQGDERLGDVSRRIKSNRRAMKLSFEAVEWNSAVPARKPMKTLMSLIAILFCAIDVCSLTAQPAADTPENRRKEAVRYLQATPPKDLFADVADKMAVNVPPAERQKFKDTLTSSLDVDALTKAMTDAMVKHFTTEELKALADFYGSPVGKSAMKKFGAYMADVMPALQSEIMKAQSKLNQGGN
jgi:hypothetical protein